MVILILVNYSKVMSNPCTMMKSINAALIIGSIVVLFVVWNFKAIFGSSRDRAKQIKFDKLKAKKPTEQPTTSASTDDVELQTAMVLSEILSLNRAAHVLTRSGSILDKLLKMDNRKACETLIRDYELSSVMVLVKHEVVVEEGFKKIENIEKVKIDEALKADKTVKVNTGKEQGIDHDDDHHHTTNDPLRIALYCKNVGRIPRVGRVVRAVQSEADHAEKYIIELIK